MTNHKFRAWNPKTKQMSNVVDLLHIANTEYSIDLDHVIWLQYTGLTDKNGEEIYFDDIIRFTDKWEWYGRHYSIKMITAFGERLKEIQAEYDAEPYETRLVDSIKDYEWLLCSDIQQYWEVIGNIFENPDLIGESIEKVEV